MSEQKKSFVLVKGASPRVVTWPVTIPVPVDGGGIEEQELRCKLEVLTVDEINQLESMASLTAFNADPKNSYGTPLLLRVLKGFDGLRFDTDGPLVPDADAIPLVLKQLNAVSAITSEYFAMVQGRPRKN